MTANPSPTEPVLGRYRPFLKLGQGGMADVYLAVSRVTPGFERLAVIKRLRADLLVEDDENPQDAQHFIAMFRDEARLAILLKHGNIVHTYDVFEDKDKLYLVMEYIEGQSLATVQRELAKTGRKLSMELAAVIVAEVLSGLHYAHELQDYGGQQLNIVHRDVSPQNILLGYDGTIKLVDFGVAKASFRSTQTRAGTMKGKARYMAPEQVMSKGVDRRADVYSAGVMLWELVAGKKLIGGANMFEQLVNVLKTPPPALSSVIPDIDPALDAIVAKALSREPSDRFDTAAAMREALLSFVGRTGTARAEDVGVLVSDTFQKQRAHVANVIRARMSTEGAAASGPRAVEAEHEANAVFIELDEERGLVNSGTVSGSVHSSLSGSRSVPSSAAPISGVIGTQVSEMSAPLVSVVMPPPAHFDPQPQHDRHKKSVLLLVALACVAVVVAAAFVIGRSVQPKDPGVTALNGTGTGSVPAAPVTTATPVAMPATPVALAPAPKEPVPTVTADASVVARPAPVAPAPRGIPAWTPPVHASPRPPPKDDAPTPTTTAATAGNDAPGFLTMDTYPWTKVTVDGKLVGSTPLVRISLAPGAHSVSMDNPGENVHQSTTIVIKSGETVSKRLAFEPK